MPHTWKRALDEYRYPVDLRKFAGAPEHDGWFELNICPGDPLQTMGFETRFRGQARQHPEAWAEVLFWKLYSGRLGIADKHTHAMFRQNVPVAEIWSTCANYIENPSRDTFRTFRRKLFKTPVVATAATFPAFICPGRFPMVDVQVARWARTSGTSHASSGDRAQLICPPELEPGQVLNESHWPFVESWIGWCRSTACELSRRTDLVWRARDVEMAVFTAQRCSLTLNPLA